MRIIKKGRLRGPEELVMVVGKFIGPEVVEVHILWEVFDD